MPDDDHRLEREVQRLSIDFEKATPLAEWDYKEVDFDVAGKLTSIKHKIKGPGTLVFLGAHWQFQVPPPTAPALYTLVGEQVQFDGYIKIRSTVAGHCTVLIGLRRDGR